MRRRPFVLLGLAGLVAIGLPATAATAATPLCFGKPATIVGTPGPDTLTGLSGVSDVIYGGGGDDVISGGDFYSDDAKPGTAPDLLCGELGNDRVSGGPGNDKVNGGDGNDHVTGGLGADVLQGNAGDDVVSDESFEDMDARPDILRGGPGNDRLTTAEGVDKAYGDGGNDVLVDLECSTSYLYGGPGADTFESYRSSLHGNYCSVDRDVIDGNDGVDRARVSTTDAVTRVESVTRVAPY